MHEGAVTNGKKMIEMRAELADLDIRLAFDDFGAGQALLVELVNVKTDYLKVDITSIHDLDEASSQKQQMVSSLVRMARDIGIVPLAEGVERDQESDVCRDLCFELGQGFYYGKPAPGTRF